MAREANAEAQWSECLEQMTVEYSARNGTSVSTSPLPKPGLREQQGKEAGELECSSGWRMVLWNAVRIFWA